MIKKPHLSLPPIVDTGGQTFADAEIQRLKETVNYKQNHVAHQQRMKVQAKKKKQHKKRK